jgi:hypothetical protein
LPDGYDEAYASKLWQLVPAYYRELDSPALGEAGPLEELLTRIAGQVAVVRRSIDRLWEDQSIESCDDWVIPYIADLVATNLVPSMDARGQRLDVANTIDYRRRKGTLGLLEQLAADVTGWEARVVELFRRLGRRRHCLDPALGWPPSSADPIGARRLQLAAGLVGGLSGSPLGGTADLRRPLGAVEADTAFDEFSHRVDVRIGRGALGWYGIPKLGVFLWRLSSLAVDRATPVAAANSPTDCTWYSFDPTGRQVALFAASTRTDTSYGETWVSPEEWQLPGPISQDLYDAVEGSPGLPPADRYPDPDASLWPRSLSVSGVGAGVPLDASAVRVWPEVGRFGLPSGAGPVECGYHYGLFAPVGAGPYDRRVRGVPVRDYPAPVVPVPDPVSGLTLAGAVAAFDGQGTIRVTDGLTGAAPGSLGTPAAPISDAVLAAADQGRAVIRFAPADEPWVFQGSVAPNPPAAALRLEALLVSGQDVVLRGGFSSVTLTCCTFDPGTAGDLAQVPTLFGVSVDGRELRPTTVWVEGTVETLVIDRCILGPVRTRTGGVVTSVVANDSILQSLPGNTGGPLEAADVKDADSMVRVLKHRPDALAQFLAGQLSPATSSAVAAHADGTAVDPATLDGLVTDLDAVLTGPLLWDPARFAGHPIRASTLTSTVGPLTAAEEQALNRRLLTEAYPVQLADGALSLSEGLVTMSRCTLLGPAHVHRLECSETILDDVVDVEDTQDGCVRFSAWATESVLPRRYECVEVTPESPLFGSRHFGESSYAQLSDSADAAVVSSDVAGTPAITSGAQDGSEIGAFCSARASLKERSLLIKYQEYMPVGMTPVLIHVPGPDQAGEQERAQPWPPT